MNPIREDHRLTTQREGFEIDPPAVERHAFGVDENSRGHDSAFRFDTGQRPSAVSFVRIERNGPQPALFREQPAIENPGSPGYLRRQDRSLPLLGGSRQCDDLGLTAQYGHTLQPAVRRKYDHVVGRPGAVTDLHRRSGAKIAYRTAVHRYSQKTAAAVVEEQRPSVG